MGLKRNFAWMSLSKAVSMFALIMTGGIINRALGPSGRGILAEMQTWVGLFIALFSVSVDTVTYHFANKIVYKADDQTKFVTIFVLNLAYGILAMLVLTLFVTYWSKQVSPTTKDFLVMLNIFLITSMLGTNLVVFFQALGNIRFSAFVGMMRAAAIIAIIGVGYILRVINLRFVIISMIVAQIAALVMIFCDALKEGFFSGQFSKNLAAGLIRKGLKQHLAMISIFIYTKVNQLIVFKYCGQESAGIFAVALTLALYLMIIPEIFQTALYPRVIHSSDDYEVTAKALRFGFYGWGSIAVLAMLFAKPLLLIYGGKDFLTSVHAFRILMVAVWLLPLSSLINPYYVKKGAFGLGALCAASLGVISIIMNLLLVPKYASTGAAAATSITCLIGFCISLFIFYYLSKRNPLVAFKPIFK